MQRAARGVAALIAVLGLTVVDANPADAHPEGCWGLATLNVVSPLYYPTLGPSKNTSWDLTFSTGVCTGGNSAAGTISGPFGGAYCGSAWSASASTNSGHSFSFTWSASTITIGQQMGVPTGNSVGEFQILSAGPGTDACVSTGATGFLLSGWWVLV